MYILEDKFLGFKDHHNQKAVDLKTEKDIELLRIAGRIVSEVLKVLLINIKPGVSTKYLDDIAFKEIKLRDAKPAFLGYRGYPATACISVNDELVHGIPRKDKILKNGDIVSIDLGVIYEGFYGDMAVTCGVGKISSEAQNLINVTKTSLVKAIEQAKPGKRLGDISWAIQEYVESQNYSVVRDYVGHGIGRNLHEEPPVPNFGQPNTGIRLVPGMVIAIEPMVNLGSYKVKTLNDGWTVVTEDSKLCAHFEHMVAITDKGNEVLTQI